MTYFLCNYNIDSIQNLFKHCFMRLLIRRVRGDFCYSHLMVFTSSMLTKSTLSQKSLVLEWNAQSF